MYKVDFQQNVKGLPFPQTESLYVPELEMALSLAGLLDRISRACPGENKLYDMFNIYSILDDEKK